MNQLVCLLLGLASFAGWAQTHDSLLDFSVVVPPPFENQIVVQPVVLWHVKEDAPNHCEQIKEHVGFAVWQGGCVYWTRAPATCTIVSPGRTTHSQLGRLFLLCLTAGAVS